MKVMYIILHITHLYYVRSGYIDTVYGALRGAAMDILGWSQLCSADIWFAYYLSSDNSVVYPSANGSYRSNAFPVRNFG